MHGSMQIRRLLVRWHRIFLLMYSLLFKFISIWVQIRDFYLYFFRHAIIVNAWLDDHTWNGVRHRNWGDDINYYFIKELTQRPVVSFFNFRLARKLNFTNYQCIGSLLGTSGYTNIRTVVWGAGSFGEFKGDIPVKILSVRGKLTRDVLINKGLECPEVYGDPALLIPLIYRPPIFTSSSSFCRVKKDGNNQVFPKFVKQWNLGIIPHIQDFNHPVLEKVRKFQSEEVLIIDLANYDNWTDVIDQICSCKKIISSSLHGLIVSDAYQIPNCWVKFFGNMKGGYFKYRDYASAVGRDMVNPIAISSYEDIFMIKSSMFSMIEVNLLNDLQKGLIASSPFTTVI